jgi:aspartate oxidase
MSKTRVSRAAGRFFPKDDGKPSKQIPKKRCAIRATSSTRAVDTTFVQFYPTLLEIAKKKGTLSPNYVKEEAAMAAQDSGKK